MKEKQDQQESYGRLEGRVEALVDSVREFRGALKDHAAESRRQFEILREDMRHRDAEMWTQIRANESEITKAKGAMHVWKWIWAATGGLVLSAVAAVFKQQQ